MLPDILGPGLTVLFAGTAVEKASFDLGFYHLEKDDKFWWMLEYGELSKGPVVSPQERKVIFDTFKTHALNDIYRKLFFEKKERILTGLGLGLTVINRRDIAENADDRSALPNADDVGEFIAKVKEHKPRITAFLTGLDLFESIFRPLYPAANRRRGKQDFTIGASEVWLLGPVSGRGRVNKALETVFDELGRRAAPRA